MIKNRPLIWGITLILILSASACSEVDTEVKPQADQELAAAADNKLRARVGEYWDAVAARDLATTYNLEKKSGDPLADPDPFSYYERQRKLPRMREARVETVEREGDRATARLAATQVLSLGFQAIQVPVFIESQWERLDGNWYHVSWAYFTPEEILKLQQEQSADDSNQEMATATPVDTGGATPPAADPVPATEAPGD
jgi:hypothetical protein